MATQPGAKELLLSALHLPYPSPPTPHTHVMGVTSKLRSGEDWSRPREGGRGEERGAPCRNMQRPGSGGAPRNPWEVAFCQRWS